jgi:hypothetical protein
MSRQRMHRVYRDRYKYRIVSDMFDQTEIADKFRQKTTYVLTFIFPSKYFGKGFTNVEICSGVTCCP